MEGLGTIQHYDQTKMKIIIIKQKTLSFTTSLVCDASLICRDKFRLPGDLVEIVDVSQQRLSFSGTTGILKTPSAKVAYVH